MSDNDDALKVIAAERSDHPSPGSLRLADRAEVTLER